MNIGFMVPNLNSSSRPDPSLEVEKMGVEKGKAVAKETPLSVSFPTMQTTSTSIHFKTKKTPIQDTILQELEKVLNQQAQEIEKELKVMKSQEKRQEFLDAILEAEGWSYDLFYSTNENMNLGIEFLEKIFPKNILDQIPSYQRLQQLGTIGNLGTTLLSALDSGAQGLSLICKTKILEKSKALLKELKAKYTQDASQKNLIVQPEQKTKQEKIRKTIQEWELQIGLEEETLIEERLQFRWNTASNMFWWFSIPLTYLPKEYIVNSLHLAKGAISWLSSGLEIIVLGIEAKQTSKAFHEFNQGTEAYKKWLDQHEPKFKILEEGPAQRIDFIDTSQELLAKRQAIIKKKILQLEPHFPSLESKIYDLKKTAFTKNMQQLLWQTLQTPHCPPQKIEEQFHAWGVFDPNRAEQNQQLLIAFEQFKNTKPLKTTEENSSISESQQNFINQLHQWMNHPKAMDQQFQHWFQTQDKETLVRFYIDHQETLEHITKNALKQMIDQKYILESHFQNLKMRSSQIYLSVAAITLILNITMTVLGLLSIPLGGVGFLLLILFNGSFIVNLGLLGAHSYQIRQYRPHSTKLMTCFFQAKMVWMKLKTSIQTYSQQTKAKKFIEVAKILHTLHSASRADKNKNVEYQKALKSYKKAKLDFEQSREKIEDWNRKLKEFEIRIAKERWKDFTQYASLKISDHSAAFDTLRAFQEAIQASDLSLLSLETKDLLEKQLGINLETLQAQIQQDPEGIKKTLQEFFILDDAGLVNFIRTQQARIKNNLLKPQNAG